MGESKVIKYTIQAEVTVDEDDGKFMAAYIRLGHL
jgi:hypothetical protein